MTTTLLPARLLAGIAVAGLIMTGCAAGTATPPGSAGPGSSAPGSSAAATAQGAHNDADVTFVQGMIPHHRQAVEMAALAAGRSTNPALLDLAARIGSGQQPEIDVMTGWLREWGAEVPAEGGGMAGMDDGGDMGGMGGMMTPEQMGQLQGATGAAFDRLFLEMMTGHHRGAVEMAEVELKGGADPDALGLAQKIIDTQRAEIAEMEALLQQV